MKRIVLLAAAAVLLCSLLASCGKEKVPVTSGETTTEITETELKVPTADYGGHTFNFLSAGYITYNDFDFEEESSMPLQNAQYKRRRKVEEDFGVTIKETLDNSYPTASVTAGPGYMSLITAYTAGDAAYDAALIAGYDVSGLAYVGALYDMASIDTLDLTNSWWDQNANESLTLKGVTFFTTGDITCSDNDAVNIIVFNKALQEQYGLENFYDAVDDGTWTLDKFGTLARQVTEDLNQDGQMNENDRFGLICWDDSICAIVSAAGQRCCVINDAGEMELTLYNESTLSALENYMQLVNDKTHTFVYKRVMSDATSIWLNNQGLFWTTRIDVVPRFRNMDSDFGILPYPKLTETQTDYYSCLAPWNSQFICVPVIQEDVSRTGVLLEALGYYGQKTVLPAYYDVNLVGQSSRDEESEAMLDIIFGNVVYDIGYIYRVGPYNKELIYMLRAGDTSFASRYDSLLGKAETSLKTINTAYSMAVADWQK